MTRITTIDAYITAAAPKSQGILREIRQIIQDEVPSATETISYQLPAFKLKRVFIYFAAFKAHIGIYPPVSQDERLRAALIPYRGVKGNLKFPIVEPFPFDLIRQVVIALAKEYGHR